MCFFIRSISQLDNKEAKKLITNFPQNQAKQIEKVHNCSKTKQKKVKNQMLGKKKKG